MVVHVFLINAHYRTRCTKMDTRLLSPSGSIYEATFCICNELSFAHSEKLLAKGLTSERIKKMIKEMLKANVAMETASKAEIVSDLYAHGVIFARKSNFSPLQLSTVVAILKRVHEACISTPFDNHSQTMKLFQELMVKHSVERPPYSSSVFSLAQVKDITDYVLTTYFKHFKLYKFAFTKRIRLDLYLGGSDNRPESACDEASDNQVQASEDGGDCEGESPCDLEEEVKQQLEEAVESPAEDEPSGLLQKLISANIDEKVLHLQATLATQMEQQEQELLARIANLETSEGKHGSKSKKGK